MRSRESEATRRPQAEMRVPCTDLGPMLDYLTDRLGFRLEMILPADAPRAARVSGHGLNLWLEAGASVEHGPVVLRVPRGCAPADLPQPPPGLRLEWIVEETDLVPRLLAPAPGFRLARRDDADWHRGRAGMEYRDLIPDRLGGHCIASHIRIPDGGPVPDQVHYHAIAFQMIYCKAGWVRVVYEDQGPPFRLEAGDCVLQPPGIRHRVLEASPGLEVIELAGPAEHATYLDHALALPSGRSDPGRRFAGQCFVRHLASKADWRIWRNSGLRARDLGLDAASDGLVTAAVLRTDAAAATREDGKRTRLFYLLAGTLGVESPTGERHLLGPDDACVLPAGADFVLQATAGSEWLRVELPQPDTDSLTRA